jgi:hypothetical protein
MSDLNDTIRLMLGTAPQAPTKTQSAPEMDTPSLQQIATNGKLLVQNLSKIAQILQGWQ